MKHPAIADRGGAGRRTWQQDRPGTGRQTPGPGGGGSAWDLDHLVGFDLVAFLDVLEVVQADAALVAGRDRADVLLEAAQGADPAVVDDHAVADQAGPGPAGDLARGDVRPGDHADPRHPERLADLGGAGLALLVLGGEQALEGLLDVLHHLVDDRVQADVDALAAGQVAGGRGRPHREADDDGPGHRGQGDVVLGDGAGRLVEHAQPDLGDLDAPEGVVDGLDRAHHVGLDDQRQLLQLALADPGEQVLQARGPAGGDGRLALASLPGLGDPAGDALVGDRPDLVAGAGRGREADDHHRLGRDGGLDLLAVLVEHGPDPPEGGPGGDRVPDVEGSPADQDGRHRAAALVQVGLDDRALSAPVGIGLEVQLDVGDQQDGLDQGVEALLGLGRHVHELGLAAVLLGHQVVLGELLADLGRVGVLLVDLVDRHHDRDPGRLGVVDRLHGLGHDPVVGRDHQHGDVGDGRAPGPHGGERLVAGGVDEGHQAAVGARPDLVGADVLGDAAGLAGDHVGVADGVQQLGLAVVDVAHDGHHRRAGTQVLVAVGLGVLPALDLLEGVGLAGVDDLDVGADLLGQQGDRLVGHRLGGGQHLAHLHEHADQVAGGLAEAVGQVLDGDPAGHADQALHRDVGVGLDGRSPHGLELLATTPAAALLGTAAAAEAAAAGTAEAATGATGTATEAGAATAARTAGTATTGTTGTATDARPAGAAATGSTRATAVASWTAATATGTTGTALTGLAAAHAGLAGTTGAALAHAGPAGPGRALALTHAGSPGPAGGRAGTRRQRPAARPDRAGPRRQRPHPGRQGASAGRQGTHPGRQRPPVAADGSGPWRQRPHPGRQGASAGRQGTHPGRQRPPVAADGSGPWRQRPHPGRQGASAGRQGTHPGRQRPPVAADGSGPWRQGTHPGRQRPPVAADRPRLAWLPGTLLATGLPRAGLAGAGLPRTRLGGTRLPGTGLAGARLAGGGLVGPTLAGAGLPRLRLTATGLAGLALGGATLRGAWLALVLPGLARPRRAAATDRRAQPVGHVLRHGRRMALGLHPHGGQLGKQVLGRDPKLFGDLIHPRVAQPDLTSSLSLERGAGWSVDPLHIRFRSASTAALAAAASVTFRARWMLRRRTAMSRQAGCPHR